MAAVPAAPDNPETWGIAASTWDVVGTLLTAGGLLFAGVAAFVAVLQHRATAQARLDQARPYVILSAVESPIDRIFIDLELANVGNGPAYDVTIKVTPPFVTSRDEAGHELRNARIFSEPIPMLAPHYTVRMFFDSVLERHERDDLPERFEALISYRDASGHAWTDELNIVDVALQKGLIYTEVYGIHHAAKALREIQKHAKKLGDKAGKVDATTETRKARDERETKNRRDHEARVRRYEEQQARQSEESKRVAVNDAHPTE